MKLSRTQLGALEAAGKEAVWRRVGERGIWSVDREKSEGCTVRGNVFANTYRSLDELGLVEVTQGLRVCPWRRAFSPRGSDSRVTVELLTLTPEGHKELTGNTPGTSVGVSRKSEDKIAVPSALFSFGEV